MRPSIARTPARSRPRSRRLLVVAALTSTVLGLTPAPAGALVAPAPDDDTREPVVAAVPSTGAPDTLDRVRAQAAPRLTAALPPAAVPARITSTLTVTAKVSKYLRGSLSGVVIDATGDSAGRALWRHNVGRTRLPASTQKLLTAHTVLDSMDLSTRLTTTVRQDPVKRDRFYLRGGADPSLTTGRLAVLARDTAAALKRQRRTYVAVYVDASVLPRPTSARGWKSSYLRSDVQRVQGLPVAGYRGRDAAGYAGRLFAAYLKRHGITATYRTAGRTPATAVERARSTSAPVSSLVKTMLAVSSNDYAEFLLRHAAIAQGAAPTWSGAIGNEVRSLREAGIPLGGVRIADGSGLSRANRLPVTTLAAVLHRMWTDPQDAEVVFAWGAIPRAGQSGTLTSRFRTSQHSCARGQVLAKTGTLSDVVALAGVARSVDGRDRVFVLLENGIVGRNTSVRRAVDTLATTVVGCALTG